MSDHHESNKPAEFARDIAGKLDPSQSKGHIIIIGLHNLGFRIAMQLKAAEIPIVFVDDDPDPRLGRRVKRMGITFIEDEARYPETLIEAGIYEASALIACSDNDLYNFETILLANDLVAGICVVASFLNRSLGEQLTRVLPNATALSLSEKAGPSFVRASGPSKVRHVFSIGREQLAVTEVQVSKEGLLVEHFPSQTVIAFKDAEPEPTPTYLGDNFIPARTIPPYGLNWQINPPPETSLKPNHLIVLCERYSGLTNGNGDIVEDEEAVPYRNRRILDRKNLVNLEGRQNLKMHRPERRRRGFQTFKSLIFSLIHDIGRPFRIALGLVGMLVLTSTMILWIFYKSDLKAPNGGLLDFSLLDALYFTVTILATVGFGDYNFSQQVWTLKVFGIILTLLGTASVSVLYAFVTNFIITRRLEQALGRQGITQMENHVVVCGLGSIGVQVMRGLVEQGRQVCVIEKNEHGRFNSVARSLGVPLIIGDAKQADILRLANVKLAQSVAILSSDDLANLETALAAHSEFHKSDMNHYKRLQVVLRVFDDGFAEQIYKNFDINHIFSASALAAPYFVGAALNYEVITTFYLNRCSFMVIKIKIVKGNWLDGLTISEIYLKTQTKVLAYEPLKEVKPLIRGTNGKESSKQTVVFHPDGQNLLTSGDIIYLLGTTHEVTKAYLLNTKKNNN